MFPTQPFSKFLIDYKRNAEHRKRRRQNMLANEKQSIRSTGKQVRFAKTVVDNEPKISINGHEAGDSSQPMRTIREEDDGNFLCVICQQLIGQEEQDIGVRPRCSDVHADARSKALPRFDFPRNYSRHYSTSDNHRSSVRYTSHNETGGPEVLVRHLSCGHVFHDQCIVPWLTENKAVCPLCQHVFVYDDKRNARVSTESRAESEWSGEYIASMESRTESELSNEEDYASTHSGTEAPGEGVRASTDLRIEAPSEGDRASTDSRTETPGEELEFEGRERASRLKKRRHTE